MKKENLLAYQYSKDVLSLLSRTCVQTPKQIVNSLTNNGYVDTEQNLLLTFSKRKTSRNNLMGMSRAFGITAGVLLSPHFLVNDISSLPKYNKYDFLYLDDIPEEFNINFKFKDVPMFLNVLKRDVPITTVDTTYTHSINLMVCSEELTNLLDKKSTLGIFSKYTPLFTIHMNKDKNMFIEIGCNYKVLIDVLKESAEINIVNVINPLNLTSYDVYTTTIFSLNKFLEHFGLPTFKYLMYSVNHAAYCYANRSNTRRINKAEKTCSVKIHVPSKESPSDDLHLVTLRDYARIYERKAYQGGHHNSPCAHERRGFFRKSRGRGDYNLINGEYIYVGRLLGNYSYIESTHVNPNNQRKVVYQI